MVIKSLSVISPLAESTWEEPKAVVFATHSHNYQNGWKQRSQVHHSQVKNWRLAWKNKNNHQKKKTRSPINHTWLDALGSLLKDSNRSPFFNAFALAPPGYLPRAHNAKVLCEATPAPGRTWSFSLTRGLQFHFSPTIFLSLLLYPHISIEAQSNFPHYTWPLYKRNFQCSFKVSYTKPL